ncbi:YraN family protein [uncultured Polaribacter sp.]|uniref:YraN family protein n=1 Tax=uncultured Polaribacter sp. TaxID=174711 RepID=UPI002603A6DD|nr:YraN family protein [uncultured Polaribacter sp.]
MAQHNELGKEGEKIAIDFLLKKGYKILETNYRYLKAEVDIIAKKGETLVAVEVKTRSSDYFENPQDAVNDKKIKLIVSATDYYVNDKDLDVEVRFDIIAILIKNNKTKIEHLEDAFLHF